LLAVRALVREGKAPQAYNQLNTMTQQLSAAQQLFLFQLFPSN